MSTGPPCSGEGGCIRLNNHSQFFNSAQHRIAIKNHGTPLATTAAFFAGLVRANETAMRLADPVSDI